MPQNSTLQSATGIRALAAGGKTPVFSARDFGPGMVQFAVSTDQNIGDANGLLLWLCDESGQEVAPVHPGPPITFETDSKFTLKNRGGASVNYCVAVLQSTSGGRRQASAGGVGTASSSGSSAQPSRGEVFYPAGSTRRILPP